MACKALDPAAGALEAALTRIGTIAMVGEEEGNATAASYPTSPMWLDRWWPRRPAAADTATTTKLEEGPRLHHPDRLHDPTGDLLRRRHIEEEGRGRAVAAQV